MAHLFPKIPGMKARSAKSQAKVKADYGTMGEPLNQAHPFYFGFLVASGAVVAITLLRAFASAYGNWFCAW